MKCPRCEFDNPTGSLYCSRCGTQLLPAPKAGWPAPTATLRAPLQELTSGTTFAGRYQVIEELGRGGMGRVYKAYDTETRETIALKILNPEIASDESTIERFRNELKLARKISHRHVCRMYDLGRVESTAFISMEYVSGEDLKTSLRRVGQFTPQRAVAVAEQVAEGLAEAHRLDIVHRDLKPQNIMIDRDGHARIMDFGIARSIKGKGLTDPGLIVGTPDYMAPELLEGKEADQRSDLYALGAMLFEMVTGEPPFEGDTPIIVATKHKTEPPRDPRQLNPQVPEPLSRLILRCLAKAPAARYPSSADLLKELREIKKALPSTRRLTGERPLPPFALRVKKRLAVALAAIILIAAAIGFFALRRSARQDAQGPGPATPAAAYKSSIAVLPFQDLSPGKDQESLCGGITDDLITKLAGLGQLKVISRTSVMRYKGGDKDVREIGKELGVETILEGSVQRERDNLRVNVQLTRARDGSNLWGETYDRKLESLFTIQDEISRAIVNALRIELVAGQDYMLVKRYTQNPDAYNLYLEARLNWSKRTEEGLKKSVELFEAAIDKDPNFALAYAGIADTYNVLSVYASLSPKDAFPKAKEAADRALEIDDSLAEAYISRAFVKYAYDWDWVGAEIDFNWAIGLNPNYATAYHWYGNLLRDLGRFEEAADRLAKASDLDPASPSICAAWQVLYYRSRQYDRAIEQGKRALKIDPDFSEAHLYNGLAYLQKGSFKKALQEFKKAENLSGGKGIYLSEIASAEAAAGNREEAGAHLETQMKRSERAYVSAVSSALGYIALGDKDKAFQYLEKAFANRDHLMTAIKVDPQLDPLRDDPRFNALLEKMNLR